MAYIGKEPANSYISFSKQDFTTSATTSYTLDHPVVNENELALFINFVRQEAGTAYTASGTSLSLTSATSASDDMYAIFLGKAIQTVNPPNSSVGSSQVSADLITGQTALASEPADTDEFLVSDAGTLKRIDYSLIKDSAGITMADQWRRTTATGITSTAAVLSSNWERIDGTGQGTLNGGMTESSGIFTFPSTGIYLILINQGFYDNSSDSRYFELKIDGTVNNSSYSTLARSTSSLKHISSYTYNMLTANTFFDVTDTSTHKIRFKAESQNNTSIGGDTSFNESNSYTFIRLGDT
jgi:hypothetical protein